MGLFDVRARAMRNDHWQVIAKAPAKLILLGEYAVLYGNTGIMSSIDIWTTVTLEPSVDSLQIDLRNLECTVSVPLVDAVPKLQDFDSLCCSETAESTIRAIYQSLVDILGTADARSWCISITVSSEVPIGRGLGSSGALSAALVAALLHLRDGQPLDKKAVKAAALKIETLFHGKTSGIDVEVSTYGGTRAFLNGKSEPISDPAREYHILLVDTGIPRDSKTMISRAKQSMADMEDTERKSMLANLENIVNRLRCAGISLEEAMGPFQRFLERLGVGHPAICGFIDVAQERFRISSKITGAGGGGCLYALASHDLDPEETISTLQSVLVEDTRTKAYTYSISIVNNTDIGVQVISNGVSDRSSNYIHN